MMANIVAAIVAAIVPAIVMNVSESAREAVPEEGDDVAFGFWHHLDHESPLTIMNRAYNHWLTIMNRAGTADGSGNCLHQVRNCFSSRRFAILHAQRRDGRRWSKRAGDRRRAA